MFEGLRHLVHFFDDYIIVLALLLQLRPAAVIDDGEKKGAEPEALLFSLACFSVLAHFLATNRPPAWLHDLLGDVPRMNVEIAYRTAVLFVLLTSLAMSNWVNSITALCPRQRAWRWSSPKT